MNNKSEKFNFNNILKLSQTFGFVWKSSPAWMIASAFLTLIQGVLPLIVLYLLKILVDSIIEGTKSNLPDFYTAEVLPIIIITGVVYLFMAISNSLQGMVKDYQSALAADYMYNILHEKASSLDLDYYENPKFYDILHRARLEAPHRPNRIVDGAIFLLQNAITLLLIVGLLFSLHWSVAFVLLIATLPSILVRVKYAGIIFRWSRSKTPIERQANYYSWILTGNNHAKELRLYNIAETFIERFKTIRNKLRKQRLSIDRKRTIIESITQITSAFAIFISYTIIAHNALNGDISVGSLVMYFMAFQRGLTYLKGFLSALAGLYEDNLFLTNLYEFLNLKSTIIESEHPETFPPDFKSIKFEEVYFTYPEGNRSVLKGIDFEIKRNEIVAIVGQNGAGKTSLVKLLCRLYDVSEGGIFVNGKNIKNFSIKSIRDNISVVFQDYSKYYLEAFENISLGDYESKHNFEDIEIAAKKAGIHDVLSSLPKGYSTYLGKVFDQGEELSIGEWQKVAIARAFLRNCPIIILDVPSSALDPRSEMEIFQRFRELCKDKTGIIISHRFSTVKMADRICVIEEGKIAEIGTHEYLMKLNNIYAKMYDIQAENYR